MKLSQNKLLILKARDKQTLKWYFDESYAVHQDMKNHTRYQNWNHVKDLINITSSHTNELFLISLCYYMKDIDMAGFNLWLNY